MLPYEVGGGRFADNVFPPPSWLSTPPLPPTAVRDDDRRQYVPDAAGPLARDLQ